MSVKYFLLNILLICIVGSIIAAPRSSVNGHSPSKIPSTVNRQPSTINRQPPTVNRQPPTDLNWQAFYKAMEENDKDLVNDQLIELKTAPANIRDAFIGAMI